jgi:hypothetical protein
LPPEVFNESMHLHGLTARLYPHVHLHLRLVTLVHDVLDGFDLELTLLLVVLVAESLPLLRQTLLRKGFKVSILSSYM